MASVTIHRETQIVRFALWERPFARRACRRARQVPAFLSGRDFRRALDL
ncbi:hypothetical protein [Nonomuraea sp. NPDC049709]